MENLKHPNYKNKNNETKRWNNMWRTQLIKVENRPLELEKIISSKEPELKDRESKFKG